MAEGYRNNPYGTSKLYKGTNSTGKVILSGYNTGSGNYFDCYLPCDTSGISSATAKFSTTNNRIYIVPDVSYNPSINDSLTVNIRKFGIVLEYNYSTTQSQNKVAILSTDDIQITCS